MCLCFDKFIYFFYHYSVALGYLARFDGKLVNAWSSGTGMAGLAGAAMYVMFGKCSQNSVQYSIGFAF